jgi:hypothetical protein
LFTPLDSDMNEGMLNGVSAYSSVPTTTHQLRPSSRSRSRPISVIATACISTRQATVTSWFSGATAANTA